MTAPAPVRVGIGCVRISAASGLDARRLADALPAALERALLNAFGAPAPASKSPADTAARQIADAVIAHIGSAP